METIAESYVHELTEGKNCPNAHNANIVDCGMLVTNTVVNPYAFEKVAKQDGMPLQHTINHT